MKRMLLFFGVVLCCGMSSVALAQGGLIGDGFTPGWDINNGSNRIDMIPSAGSSQITTRQATGTGNRFFRLFRGGGNLSQMSPSTNCNNGEDQNLSSSLGNVITVGNQNCGNSAYFINVSSISDNYVFKTASQGGNTFTVFRVQGAVRSVSSVSQSPTTVFGGQSVTVTATISGSLNTGQGVYLRYTTDNFATSTVVNMTGSATTYTASIPASANTRSTTVRYYVFTSTDNTSQVNTNGSNSDFYTINLNNNGGSNYSYSTPADFATTAAGNWSSTATWLGGSLPSAGSPVTLLHNVTLDQDATVSTLTINSGVTFTASDASPRTLTISNNGNTIAPGPTVIANNGTWALGSGASTVAFTGANSSGTNFVQTSGNISFNNASVTNSVVGGTLGVTLGGASSTLSGTFTLGARSFVHGFSNTSFYTAGSTFSFNQGSGQNYNVTTSDNSWPFANGAPNISINSGTVTFNAALVRNIRSTGTLTVASGATLTVTGATLNLVSDVNGTAQINNSAGTINGNITVQRFIPAKTSRRWTLVSSPVSQQINNAWQQQIYITGTTAGTVCTTDASGFDISNAPSPSMFTYNATPVSGSRWVSVANTNATNLTRGVGYRVNIRGTRDNGGGCTNQLNSATPAAPNAVTLSATGAYAASGTITIAGTTAHGSSPAYSLVGNPHPATISFTSFRTSNSTAISNQLWMFSPNGNVANSYMSWNAGTFSGTWPSELQDGSNPLVPSGSAFFVSTTEAADQSLAFGQSDKHTTSVGGNTTFSRTTQNATTYTWNAMARVTLQNVSGSYLDDAVVRFGTDADITNTSTGKFDGVSFNTGNSAYITTVKAGQNLTFNTRSLSFTNDTVQLNVFSNATGNYKLSFSDMANFTEAGEIILRDKFLNQTQNVKITPEYNFAITTDPASVGANRFEMVFRGAATLPVNFSLVKAQNTGATSVTVQWSVPAEVDIKEYIVERSANGTSFAQRGTVAASANGAGTLQYSFVDAPRLEGTSFYRIKVIAKNGASKYSPIVSVRSGKAVEALQVLPNPVATEATILLQGFEGNTTVQIQSMTGSLIKQFTINATSVNMLRVPMTDVPAGVYQVRAVQANTTVTQKLIKQ